MRISALLLFLFSALPIFADDRPNIVLILSDDMGYSDVGAHGSKDIPTPYIDRIAKEGVRFTQAYANGSFCTPTRIALLGCRYQQRTGNDDLPQVTGPLPLPIKTLSDRLQESGYTTGMVGNGMLVKAKVTTLWTEALTNFTDSLAAATPTSRAALNAAVTAHPSFGKRKIARKPAT